jgi:hypothetical protein
MLSIVACIAVGSTLFTLAHGGAWIAATLWTSAVVIASVVATIAMLRRAKRADGREIAAGYSTMIENDFGFERRDPKTGRVVERATSSRRLGQLAAGGESPIVGGALVQPVSADGTAWQGFLRDRVGLMQLVVGVLLEVLLVFLAATSPGLWARNPDVGEIVSFWAESVGALVFPFFLVGNPFVRLASRFAFTLSRELSAVSAWKVTSAGDFSALAHQLPMPETQSPIAGWTLYFALTSKDASFWSRRGANFYLVLRIPVERVSRIEQETSNFGSRFLPGLNLSVVSNNGEIVELEFIPNASGWRPGLLLADRFVLSINRVLGGS